MKLLKFLFLFILFPSHLFSQPACTISNVPATPAGIKSALGMVSDNFVMCLTSTSGMGGSGNIPANMSNFDSPVSPVSTTGVLDVGNTIAGEIRGAGSFNTSCLQADNITFVTAFNYGCGSAQQTKLYMNNSSAIFWWHTTSSTSKIVISNIYFYADINSTLPAYGFILPGSTNAVPFILHHNDYIIHFANLQFVTNTATNRGLNYRNRFISDYDPMQPNAHVGQGIQHSDGGAGTATWATNSTFGSADDGTNNLYIEQNYFYNFPSVNDLHDGGAREVWRFNEIHNSATASHGLDSTGSGGGRGIEMYRNLFYCDAASPPIPAYITQRTGTGFFFDNTFNAYSSNCNDNPLTVAAALLNQDASEECNSGSGGWPGQSLTQDAVHNSYPIPHQIGWGFDNNSATNPVIGTSPSSGTAIHQTNIPGATSGSNVWPYPSDGVQQSLEPMYAMHNTNNVMTNNHLLSVKTGPTNCRAMAWSNQTKVNSQTLQIPIDIPNVQPFNSIPYANVGMQAIMVLADNIGSGTITPTIKVNGSNSCGSITTLNAGTNGSMRLSAYTCTITIDGPQTVLFTSSASASTAARAGTVIFLRGISSVDKNPTVATVSMSPYTANAPMSNYSSANTVVIGYFALPVAITDNLQPGTSDNLPMQCNFECASYTGAGNGFGRYVGTNGTTGGADVSVATTYRVVNSVTPIAVQESDSDNTMATVLAGSVSFVVNGSTANFATTKIALDMNSTDFIRYNHEIYDDIPSTGGTFDGTSGTGSGTKAQLTGSSFWTNCTDGVGFWVTNEGTWNNYTSTQGQLYKCTSNSWAVFYTPYIMPHPLNTVNPSPNPPGVVGQGAGRKLFR